MGIGTAKEGLSVFGLLNTCVTPMGRRLLRTWFVRIATDLEVCAFTDKGDMCGC